MKTPHPNPSPTPGGARGVYLFSPFAKSPDIVKASFDVMDSVTPKPAKIGIFAEKTDWGKEMRDLYAKEAKARGDELVIDVILSPTLIVRQSTGVPLSH